MEKLKLNKDMGKIVKSSGYKLDTSKEYIINLDDELQEQISILQAVQAMGLDAMKDWWKWLEENDFDTTQPNPTNSFVADFYSKRPLWRSNLSQGLVVKNENDDDYYIIMECSRENEGFKYTQIVLTLGGCI